jgi:hypothetical protein
VPEEERAGTTSPGYEPGIPKIPGAILPVL